MRRSSAQIVALAATLLFSYSVAWAQDANDPVVKRVTEDIKYLASDELAGRKPGTEGIEKAAVYIEDLYKSLGLATLENGTYRQDFEVQMGMTVDSAKTSLKFVKGDETIEMKLAEDFMAQASRRGIDLDAEVVFVGYGINAEDLNYNEYRDVDVNGKIVVQIRREPQQDDANSVFAGTEVSTHAYIRTKTRAAREAGAVGIIMVNDGFSASDDEKDVLEDPTRFGGNFPYVQLKRSVFDKLLSKSPLAKADGKKLSSLKEIEAWIDQSLSPVSQPMAGWKVAVKSTTKENMATTSNIVGIIEGEGPNANESIIIGGHYDHLGMGGAGSRSNVRAVHNGADDNATGTAAVMELARRFAKRDKKPSRRLVFIAFSAEEMGLLGARHYVESDPIYKLTDTAAMVNFDMIGWLREDKLTIYNANSAVEFEGLLDRANADISMDLVKSSGFGGSDHLPFFQREVPVMFIHTGLTSTYHTPEDDFATIDCGGAVKVINYSEKVIDELLTLENKPTFQNARRARARTVRLGVSLNDAVENGVEVTRVLEGSIAEQNDFQIGDVITAVGPEAVDKRREVNREIRANSGKTVMFKLRRGEEQMEKLIELKQPSGNAGG